MLERRTLGSGASKLCFSSTKPENGSVRRYYDPTTGQFISVDPAVDQTEAPYAYTTGDPVDGIDPLGLWGWNPIDDAESAWSAVNPLSSSNVFYGIASSGGVGASILGYNPLLPAAADFVGAANACSSGTAAEDILAGLGWTALGAIDPEADEAGVAAEEAGGIEASWGAGEYREGGLMSSIEHINYRHAYESGFANVSRFSEGTSVREIKNYVAEALAKGELSSGAGTQVTYDLGRVIGTDRAGNPVTGIRVVIRDGIIRTAYPVAP